MSVRTIFQAVKIEESVAPYDTLHVRIFYSSRMTGSNQEHDMGIVPANPQYAPFPIVVLFNGINCGPEVYQWLATDLAERGLVTITFSWVAENIPGVVALTPGVDFTKLAPNSYGTGPTATALPALLAMLERLQADGILTGLLDLQRIVLGGHSAGGRVVIESANPTFFPQVIAAFSYAAHTAAVVQLGYKPDTILPLSQSIPFLLMGGTCDGVIARSSDRYGVAWEQPTTPIIRTFEAAIAGGREDCYLLLLEGANHFSFTYPVDATTGRSFLDFPATQPAEALRHVMAEAISKFIDIHVRVQPSISKSFHQLISDNTALIALFKQK